jgi:hypothetical protein
MPNTSWAQPGDVLTRWVGADKPDDQDLLSQLIADAERAIIRTFPDVQDRIDDTDDTLEVDDLKLVVARMVIRHLRNPDGTRQVTETEGPFSRNRTFAGDHPGQLLLNDNDRELLGYPPAGTPKAFSIPMGDGQPQGFIGGDHVG